MTTPSTLKLTRYLRSREEPLANLWAVDDAFIRAGMRGGATVKWETIRAGLADAKAALWTDASSWSLPRYRRYRAVLGRAQRLRRAIRAKDVAVFLDIALFAYPFVWPGRSWPEWPPYEYRMPPFRYREDIIEGQLIPCIQASTDPLTQKAFDHPPPFPSDGHRAAWDAFITRMSNRYGVTP